MVRIGGLASGMDIDTLVADLMKAERMGVDKLKQKKQTLEWQRDDYRSMNTLLLNFRTELTQMKLSTKYRARTTTTTNDSMVTATASSSAAQSSVNISKITQLASSEKITNGSNIGLSSSKSLYSQTSSNAMWKKGVVETKTLTADGTTNPISVGVPAENLSADVGSWSVKVNGKAYKVVNNSGELNDSTVYVDTSGNLQFSNTLAKDSTIKVDYIAKQKTDTLKLNHDTTSVQLSRGSISELFPAGSQQIKLTQAVKDGASTESYFSIAADPNTDGLYEISDGTNVVGTLDKDSGNITFTDNFKGYLPPDQTEADPETKKEYNYSLEITYNQNYTNFSIDTVTSKGNVHENFLIQGNEKISSITSKVSTSNVGVSLFYDEFSGQMSLSRKETGKYSTDGSDIKLDGVLINDVFKFNDPNTVTTAGTNAKFEINGITTERKTNNFTIDGVTFTLKQTFGAAGTTNPDASPVTINVNNDSQQVFDNIVEFINKYNELIGKVQGETQEERYRSYTPLTDEQRESLTDKQQEQWEEKARSGLLRRDPILSSTLSEMRMNFYQPVQNESVSSFYNQLSKIGIKTTANYLEGGKLEIDEAELKKAIEDDPASVEKLFNADGTTDGERGIVQRLYDTVNKNMDKLKEKAGNTFSTNQQFAIGRQLSDTDKRIDRFEDRLTQIEDRYWRQFTAMEKAIQQANSQSMYLSQQFMM